MDIRQKNYKGCDICKIEATSLCLSCYSYLCDECFKYVHSKKENINHKKDKIDYFVPIDIKCPEHDRVPINLFCLDEKGNTTLYNILLLLNLL